MAVELAATGRAADYDDRLAIRVRDGDAEAFDEIVSRYQGRLYRFAFRMLQDHSEAEDAVQATFVRAYRALASYKACGFFSSWMYRIALNECRRRLRSRRTAPLSETQEQPHDTADPQSEAVAADRNRIVRDAVCELPEHYRDVMTLFYFDEMSVEQVSRTLGISASATKVRLHRGRARLGSALAGRI